MKIRDAIPSDLPAMISIDPYAKAEGKEKRCQQIHQWVTEGDAIVAMIDDLVAGYAVMDYHFFGFGFISMLIVEDKHKRQGVATALIKALEERCETEKIFTSTNESNVPMQALLHRMSYEPSGTVYNLDDGDPELFFVKRMR